MAPLLLAAALALSPARVAGETTEAPGAGVALVRVDVTVTDREGRPVPDLTVSEFEVMEDGLPRVVSNFSYVVVGAGASTADAVRPAARGDGGDIGLATPEATRGSNAPRARQSRTLAFVVDDLNLSRTSVARTRQMLERFAKVSLQQGDLAGVFRTGASSNVVTLRGDRDSLLVAISGLSWNGRSGRERPVDPIQEGLTAPISIGQHLDARRPPALADASLAALQALIRALEPVPGRKTVIFVSDGLRVGRSTNALDRLVETADHANRESVVVYTLDPRGVQAMNFEADDFDNDPGFQHRIPMWLDRRAANYEADHDGLGRLAEATGGLFIHDTDVGKGLQKVLVDQSGYYLLGYQPEGSGRRFHRLTVTVRRPGVRVRARAGYWSD